MSVRKFGWSPDERIVHGDLTHDRYGAAKPLPSKYLDLALLVGGRSALALPVLDQGQTSRCVLFSGGEVIHGRLAHVGAKPRLINLREGYVQTQRWEQNRKGRRVPLADNGLQPIDFVEMISTWGCTSFADTSASTLAGELADARVNEDVFVDEYEAAADHKVTGWRRVDDALPEDEIVHQAKQLLVAGFPGMDGTDLDQGFIDYSGGTYERNPQARSVGRHMTSTHGFDDSVGPDGAFLKLNHWDWTWGLGGWFWMSYRTYARQFVSDRYFLDATVIG